METENLCKIIPAHFQRIMEVGKMLVQIDREALKKPDYFMTIGEFHLTPPLNYDTLNNDNLEIFTLL